jgi:hypothetical protein
MEQLGAAEQFYIQSSMIRAQPHLPLLLQHTEVYEEPADKARVELAEFLEVKAADARIQLPPHEEVVDRMPCFSVSTCSDLACHDFWICRHAVAPLDISSLDADVALWT